MSKSKSKFDEGYESGYQKGLDDRLDKQALVERYNYLRIGGMFQRVSETDSLYLDGFLDAMKTLGVLP